MNRRLFLKGLGLAAAATAAGGARAIDRAPSAPIESFTFAFFTDVHLPPDLQAPEGVRMAMEVINRSGADFAICGGDHILDGLARSREHILQQYALYRIIEKQLRIPVRHVLGNHDIAGVLTQSGMSESDPVYGKALFRDMFDTPTYYRFEHKGVQFIVLDSIQIAGRGWEPRIDDEQIAWLQRTLDAHRDMMTIVITHVPLATSISNYYPGSESAIFTPVVNNRGDYPPAGAVQGESRATGAHAHFGRRGAAWDPLHHRRRSVRQLVARRALWRPRGRAAGEGRRRLGDDQLCAHWFSHCGSGKELRQFNDQRKCRLLSRHFVWIGIVRGGASLLRLRGLLLAESLDARVQAALVARRGVLVDDALLHALIDGGNGGAVLLTGGLGIALLESLAEGPQFATDAAAVGAVHCGLLFSLTGALERRNMVRHEKFKSRFRKWMQADGRGQRIRRKA